MIPPRRAPADTAPLRVYFVRHGETAWALTGQHTGRTDLGLTAHGEDQARELEPRLRGIRFADVLRSPRGRAQRTCELAGLDAAAAIEGDLAEWDYGDYEGRTSVDIVAGRPGWDLFRDGCPNGEMPTQICVRVDRLIARLRALRGNVVLFSHGQLGGVLAARWLGLPLAAARHFPLGTASLSVLSSDPHHPEVAVIAQWNAAARPQQ